MKKINSDIIKLKIYYEDTDSAGIVYHSKYLNFAERGRTEYLKKANLSNSNIWEKYKIRFVVHKLTIDYISFAKLEEILCVETNILQISKVKIKFNQLILCDKKKISNLLVDVCCINKYGKVARIPKDIYYKFIE